MKNRDKREEEVCRLGTLFNYGLHSLECVRREGRVKIEVGAEGGKEDYIRDFHIVG